MSGSHPEIATFNVSAPSFHSLLDCIAFFHKTSPLPLALLSALVVFAPLALHRGDEALRRPSSTTAEVSGPNCNAEQTAKDLEKLALESRTEMSLRCSRALLQSMSL